MIVFDLACGAGHVFEGWFGSTDDYEAQRGRGLVTCPLCGAGEVTKAPMAPRVPAKSNQAAPTLPVRTEASAPSDDTKAKLRALHAMQAKLLESSSYVGPRFAAEARAIHDGDAPTRQIHGEATLADAKALIDDGIGVAPLPLPVRPPGTDN